MLEIFDQMLAEIRSAPRASVRAADLGRPNPPIKVDFSGSVPSRSTLSIRLLVSEIIHHVRAAADYLIYNAAWLDSGAEQSGTQFPIFGTAADFNTRGRRMMVGVNATHQGWIEAVQPFNDISWTRSLQQLSNADKHRYLLDVAPTLHFRLDLHAASPIDGMPDRVSLPTDQLQLHLRLVPRDGGSYLAVDEMLAEIVIGFVELLNKFLIEASIPPVQAGFIARPSETPKS